MIAYIEGKVFEDEITSNDGLVSDSVVVLVGGIGYELICSQNTLDDFFGCGDIRAWTYTHAREDALQLFGFSTKAEKRLFHSLLKVNGIGPKMAIKVLSGARTQDIIIMVESADAKSLASLPKIGKKKAEQIILTLKGKLSVDLEVKATGSSGNLLGVTPILGVKKQITSALVNLGFKSVDVESIVRSFSEEVEFDDGVRKGLSVLSGSTSLGGN